MAPLGRPLGSLPTPTIHRPSDSPPSTRTTSPTSSITVTDITTQAPHGGSAVIPSVKEVAEISTGLPTTIQLTELIQMEGRPTTLQGHVLSGDYFCER